MSIISAGNTTTTALTQTADTSGNLVFTTGGANTTALAITNAQYVGIGTTTPNNQLTVVTPLTGTTVRSNTAFRLQSQTTGRDVNLQFSDTLTNAAEVGMLSGDMYFSTAGSEKMRLTTAGSLGINTSAPGSRLSVYGTSGQATVDIRNDGVSDLIYTWGNTAGSAGSAIYIMPIRTGSTSTLQGGLYWNGSVMSLQGTSDYRLKENVQPLTNCLDKVTQLNPVSYTWKEQKTNGKGFIAHELQAVIPEAVVGEKDAVDEDGNIKPQSIDQTQLIVYLTKAIQELKAEVDSLKAKLGA